jgi:host factor-I protein
MASGNSFNVQDVYMNKLRRNEIPVKCYLIDGTERTGRVAVFDACTLVLVSNENDELIYKNNVVRIAPSQSGLRVFLEDVRPDWAKHSVHGQDPNGEYPDDGLTLGERGICRVPFLERPNQPHYPS